MFIFLTTKFFQSLVSSECSRLVEAATEKLSVKVEEQNSEIRKLKAMIGEIGHYIVKQKSAKMTFSVKHETRIRTLETKNKEQEKMLVSKGILLNNNGHNDLDPDEV